MKNEPLANLTSDLKKRKLSDEKVGTSAFPPIHIAPPSPTSSLEVTAATPPLIRAKGKSKLGMSVWDDPATALGRAHNVITNDELRGLSSIPSHELVSRHIQKLVQVCNSVISTSLFGFAYVDEHNFFSYLLIPTRFLGSRCISPLIT